MSAVLLRKRIVLQSEKLSILLDSCLNQLAIDTVLYAAWKVR